MSLGHENRGTSLPIPGRIFPEIRCGIATSFGWPLRHSTRATQSVMLGPSSGQVCQFTSSVDF